MLALECLGRGRIPEFSPLDRMEGVDCIPRSNGSLRVPVPVEASRCCKINSAHQGALSVLFVADPSYVIFRLGMAAERDWLDVPLYLPFKALGLDEV
jgi:hypothetical protein